MKFKPGDIVLLDRDCPAKVLEYRGSNYKNHYLYLIILLQDNKRPMNEGQKIVVRSTNLTYPENPNNLIKEIL